MNHEDIASIGEGAPWLRHGVLGLTVRAERRPK